MASIAGRPYIVGMSNRLYRRTTLDQWEPVDTGIPSQASLEAIAGSAEDDMYVVGWKGHAYWIRDGAARPIPIDTGVILTAVCLGGDGFAYCCGQRGVLARGTGDSWELIAHESTTADLWDVQWFQGALYVSSVSAVYRLEDGRLNPVGGPGYHLDAVGDSHLLSVGGFGVELFDGSSWESLM